MTAPRDDGTWVSAADLAEVLATALLGLDDGDPPHVLAVLDGRRSLEVLGLRYDPRQHAIVLLVEHPTYGRSRWVRPGGVGDVDTLSHVPLETSAYRRLRGFPPRRDVTFTFEPGSDAWDALRFAYGGPTTRPTIVNDAGPVTSTGNVPTEPPDVPS